MKSGIRSAGMAEASAAHSSMRRAAALLSAVVLIATGCTGGAGSDRVVNVDHRNDEFASYYWRYFPRDIDAHPGDTIVFKQEWTGEPHTVTLGTLVDKAIPALAALEKKYANLDVTDEAAFAQAEAEFDQASAGLPVFDVYAEKVAQAGAQPCFLDSGPAPDDPAKPCPRHSGAPAFSGREAIHSSGFIPFEGAQGNQYKLKLSADIAPGTYSYICLIHFPQMRGRLIVKPQKATLTPPEQLTRRAQGEIEKLSAPLRKAFEAAKKGEAETGGQKVALPMGGYHSSEEYTVAINEFLPKKMTVKAGRKVTWTIVGAHTVSFDVPRYGPIYVVKEGGEVVRNPIIDPPAGGSPPIPPIDFTKGPVEIDGGTWNGSGFISSGLLGSEPFSKYSLTFTKPGRYRYACLIHPPMVGTVVVVS